MKQRKAFEIFTANFVSKLINGEAEYSQVKQSIFPFYYLFQE